MINYALNWILQVQMKTVELKMNMHCEGCAKDIKQTIGRMEGKI